MARPKETFTVADAGASMTTAALHDLMRWLEDKEGGITYDVYLEASRGNADKALQYSGKMLLLEALKAELGREIERRNEMRREQVDL